MSSCSGAQATTTHNTEINFHNAKIDAIKDSDGK